MMLLMRNQVNEFAPGCDHTVVRLDDALVDLVRRRAIACAAVRYADDSLAELRYWDASPECIGSLYPEAAASLEGMLGRGDGWAALDDDALGQFEAAGPEVHPFRLGPLRISGDDLRAPE
jgi:hypothetical protein